jgi:hypothetical protein
VAKASHFRLKTTAGGYEIQLEAIPNMVLALTQSSNTDYQRELRAMPRPEASQNRVWYNQFQVGQDNELQVKLPGIWASRLYGPDGLHLYNGKNMAVCPCAQTDIY